MLTDGVIIINKGLFRFRVIEIIDELNATDMVSIIVHNIDGAGASDMA